MVVNMFRDYNTNPTFMIIEKLKLDGEETNWGNKKPRFDGVYQKKKKKKVGKRKYQRTEEV